MNVIEVENLTFSYSPPRLPVGRQERGPVLRCLALNVAQGRFLAIAGPNGTGKTTLLKLLCGLLKPQAGTIKVDSRAVGTYSIKELARKTAVVHQEQTPVFDFSAREVVSMARTPYLGTLGFETEADSRIVSAAMEMTDTARFERRPLRQLSGGERQRVLIARAIAQETAIMLLDEPTSFLDMKHQAGIYDLLKKMQLEKGKTIVLVTHDINLAAQYCDEVLLLGEEGRYEWGGVGDILSKERIERVFGVRTITGTIANRRFFLPMGEYCPRSCLPTERRGGGPQDK